MERRGATLGMRSKACKLLHCESGTGVAQKLRIRGRKPSMISLFASFSLALSSRVLPASHSATKIQLANLLSPLPQRQIHSIPYEPIPLSLPSLPSSRTSQVLFSCYPHFSQYISQKMTRRMERVREKNNRRNVQRTLSPSRTCPLLRR